MFLIDDDQPELPERQVEGRACPHHQLRFALPDHVPEEVKAERFARFMEKAQAISKAKLAAKVGQRLEVIIDEVDTEAATCRTKADAPEIDGNLFVDEGFEGLSVGDVVTVEVEEAGEYDLWGRVV